MPKKQSLVQKAKSVRRTHRREFTKEEVDLAIAWVNDEVTVTQMCKVFGYGSSGQIYVFLARALRQRLQQ